MTSRTRAWLSVALVSGAARSALADEALVSTGSLRARLGVKRAETLAVSASKEERVRGLERLGASGSPRALERLTTALEPSGSASSPEERLTAVRALAWHASDPDARRALARVLGGHVTNTTLDSQTSLDELAEDTAALALARSGTPEALTALGRELGVSGRAADAATNALIAYPPRDLGPLLRATRVSSEALVAALDALGDQRAFDRLRELATTGTVEVRARAAVALTHLGDYETLELARRWVDPSGPVPLRVAAARILSIAHADDTSAALLALLRDPKTANDGVALASEAPSRALVSDLLRLLDASDDEHAPLLITALGLAGGPEAARRLRDLMTHETRGAWAVDALGRMPGPEASAALADAFRTHTSERLAARAATIRYLAQGEVAPGFGAAAARLIRSRDPADRAAAAASYVALDPGRAMAFLQSKDPAIVKSVAALVPLVPAAAAESAAARLSVESDAETRAALATALVFPSAEALVPRATLLAFIDDGSAAAPLAARALAARDDAEHELDTNALLADREPWIRSHAALGLGRSPRPDATGRLASAYRFEAVADVRAAIVCALSAREDRGRTATLNLAESLDPSAAVRALARRANHGERLLDVTGGPAVALVSAVGQAPAPRNVEVAVRAPGGLSLPASTGAEGLNVVAGLPRGSVVVRVAPREKPDDDSTRGDRGNPKSDRIDRHQQGP